VEELRPCSFIVGKLQVKTGMLKRIKRPFYVASNTHRLGWHRSI